MTRLFVRQIGSRYCAHPPLSEYARRAAISANYLNQLCREFYNCSALIMRCQRLMAEAKSGLQYMAMTLGQVSDYLGFNEVTYFSPFFKKYAKMFAKSFRKFIKNGQLNKNI